MDLSRYGEVIYHAVEKCPFCNNVSMEVQEVLYEIPHFGKTILHIHACSSCGYRHIDLQYVEEAKPRKMIYPVDDEEDVTETLIFRSKTCKIYSPELGFSIDPGQAAEALITTLEGLLYKVKDYAETMLTLTEEENIRDKIMNFIRKINDAIHGNLKFTIILEDPMGNSIIKPPSHRVEKLIIENLQ